MGADMPLLREVTVSELKYKRVLLKLSGEALMGENGILDFSFLERICAVIKKASDMGAQVSCVIGGGNIWRGRQGGSMDKTRADHMGMTATLINSIALQDTLIQSGVDAVVLSAVRVEPFAEFYDKQRAVDCLSAGKVVIFACGTGNPYFSTDTGAVLRGAQIGADVLLFAKNIDGVYTADPRKDTSAVRLDRVSYSRILAERLGVIDMTAAAFAMENGLKILLFALDDPENIIRALKGDDIGTLLENS